MNAPSRLLARFTSLLALALFALMLGAASPALASKTYSDNGDGTVTDPTTGLTWIRCSIGQTWAGYTCNGTPAPYTFDQAKALPVTVTFAGQSDWRLPNIRELQTIVERSVYSPAIDWMAFPNTPWTPVWSASAEAGPLGTYQVWVVNFNEGDPDLFGKLIAQDVRLVRGGQPFGLLDVARPSTDYVDPGNGTVTHTPTSLMWQRCAVGQTWTGSTCNGTAGTFTWDEANLLTSTFAGQSDWRLPTAEELLSLVDYSQVSPAINATLFPNTPASYFWSTSVDAYPISGWAWHVHFGAGQAYVDFKSNGKHARLVRTAQSSNTFTLTVAKTGSGTVTSSAAGINCGATCSASYSSGTSVTLTTTPDAGSTFAGWSGACTGTGTTCTVTMNQAQSVTATFVAGASYTLSVTKSGTGSGTVTTWSINCGTICIASLPSGTSVTLSAIADAGSTFSGWSGAGCSGTGTCTVLMNQAQNVTATFTASSAVLPTAPTNITVIAGNSSVSVSFTPGSTGSGTLITYVAACGKVSDGSWNSTNLTYGTGMSTPITVSGLSNGTAYYCWTYTESTVGDSEWSLSSSSVTPTAASSYALTVIKLGTGSGTVTGSNIYCGIICRVVYPSGTSVTLIATVDTGSTFGGWSGAGCSGTGTCTVSMNQAQNVTAIFTFSGSGLYDGIYQWDDGYYLSVHQIGGGVLIGTIYWVYTANTEQVGARAISGADTFDLFHGQLVGSSATMSGTRFYRACTLSYDLTFNSDASLTMRLNSISNSPGVSAADVDCAAMYNSVGSAWTIPRIY